jgi:hypothetical protein
VPARMRWTVREVTEGILSAGVDGEDMNDDVEDVDLDGVDDDDVEALGGGGDNDCDCCSLCCDEEGKDVDEGEDEEESLSAGNMWTNGSPERSEMRCKYSAARTIVSRE